MSGHQQMLAARLLFVVLCSLSIIDLATPTAATSSSPQNDSVFDHVSRTISSITIRWNSTTYQNGTEVHIEAFNTATLMTIVGPKVAASSVSEFVIPDLAVDTEYRVCLHVGANDAAPSCDVIRTIPTVRFDTMLAVLVIVGFIGFLIFTAFICWRCAMRQNPESEDDQAANDVENNGKPTGDSSPTSGDDQVQVNDEKSPLLHASGGGKSTKPDASNSEQPPTTLYLFLASPAAEKQ